MADHTGILVFGSFTCERYAPSKQTTNIAMYFSVSFILSLANNLALVFFFSACKLMRICGSSKIYSDVIVFRPQISIDCVIPLVQCIPSDQRIAFISTLEEKELLPRNKYDLWKSVGLEGYPPQCATRSEIVSLLCIATSLNPRLDGK
jgi:hypothetical protein